MRTPGMLALSMSETSVAGCPSCISATATPPHHVPQGPAAAAPPPSPSPPPSSRAMARHGHLDQVVQAPHLPPSWVTSRKPRENDPEASPWSPVTPGITNCPRLSVSAPREVPCTITCAATTGSPLPAWSTRPPTCCWAERPGSQENQEGEAQSRKGGRPQRGGWDRRRKPFETMDDHNVLLRKIG